MESEVSDDRPLSPKKKLKPNSTSNSEVSESNCCENPCNSTEKSDVADSATNHVYINGLAPTRSGRSISSSSHNIEESSPTTNLESPRDSPPNDNARVQNNILSIQEEEVSSSENCNVRTSPSVDTEGDADSLMKEEPGEALPNNSGEAEKKKL